MMHTIVPIEQILEQKPMRIVSRIVSGAVAEFCVDDYGRETLSRMYSTDPKAYL